MKVSRPRSRRHAASEPVGKRRAGLSSFFGAVAGAGVDQLNTGIGGLGDDQVYVIGQTDHVRLEVDTLPTDKDKPLRMNLALIVPDEVRKPYFELGPNGPVQKELVLPKGTHNGNIILRLAALPLG